MTEMYVSNPEFAERLLTRSAEYVTEIERCITRRDAGGFFIDVDSVAYQAMIQKYRQPPPQAIPDGFDPEQERRRMSQGGCCGAPSRE